MVCLPKLQWSNIPKDAESDGQRDGWEMVMAKLSFQKAAGAESPLERSPSGPRATDCPAAAPAPWGWAPASPGSPLGQLNPGQHKGNITGMVLAALGLLLSRKDYFNFLLRKLKWPKFKKLLVLVL